MGSTIDDKVVAMSFDNNRFESGVRTTINSLDRLKSSLQFTGADRGLNNLSRAANGVNLDNLGNSVDRVRYKFSAFNVAASAILAHVAIRAFETGTRIAKAFTLGPIIQGLDIYQTKLQAIKLF